MAGFQKAELPEIPVDAKGLTDLVESDYPFAIDPMPNLYFTRDPFATIGNAVSLNHMYSDTRNRETLYGKYILNTIQYMVAMLNWFITVKKQLVSKVEMN